MIHIGFGTMNGKDGKPFKTRDGGVMRLEHLIADINEAVYNRIMENREIGEEEAREIAKVVGLSALKYGDYPIRLPRIIFLILTDLFPLREIQGRIFYIRLCG